MTAKRPENQTNDHLRDESTLPVEAITLENVRLGNVAPNDLSIRRAMLVEQALTAEREGYSQLARNFRRAAELVAVPNDVLMTVYEKLRPHRAGYTELLSLGQEIAGRYDAPETGAYIREAAEVYLKKGLCKP